MSASACGDASGPVPTTLTVLPDSVGLTIGATHQFTATVLDQDAAQITGISVSFHSTDPTIAQVTNGGLVSGVAIGRALIIGTASAATDTAIVDVQALGGLALSPDSLDMTLGGTAGLVWVVTDLGGVTVTGLTVTFSSANTSVATVDARGNVTGVGIGTTTVTAAVANVRDSSFVLVRPRIPIVVASPAASGRPFGAAVRSDGLTLVGRQDDDMLTQLALPAGTVTRAMAVGRDPGDIAFAASGSLAFVTNVLGGSLAVVDVATGTWVDTIPIAGAPLRVAANAAGTVIYATNDVGYLYRVDVASRTITDSVFSGAVGNGIWVDSASGRVYVSANGVGRVVEHNAAGVATGRAFAVGGRAQDIWVSSDGAELWAANENGYLSVVTLANGGVTPITGVGCGAFGLRGVLEGALVVVSCPSQGLLVFYDRASRTRLDVLDVGGKPRRIAEHKASGSIVVPNEGNWVSILR